MKVAITLPVPMSFMTQVEKHLADRKPRRGTLISARKKYERYDWIEKAYWRITIAILDNVDAIGVGILEMAVKQAAVGFKQIAITSNRLSTQPVENHYYGARRIVGLDIGKGKAEIINLAEKIDAALTNISKGTGRMFRNRIKRPFTPYLAILRQGRTTRALSTFFALETIFEPPIECVLNQIVVNISGKLSNGEQYRLQKWVKLRCPS